MPIGRGSSAIVTQGENLIQLGGYSFAPKPFPAMVLLFWYTFGGKEVGVTLQMSKDVKCR